jgi:hypothetical protein
MFAENGKARCYPKAVSDGTAFTRVVSTKSVQKDSAQYRRVWKRITTLSLGALLLLSIFLVSNANAEQVERQDFGSGGVFSYVPPSGWKVADFPGLKFKISHGAPVNGIAPNIVVADEAYNKSLDDYAKDNTATIQKMFHGMKILGQNDFTTSDGARAIKEVMERDDDLTKKRLRQIFYFYDAGNKKLVATCTALAETASVQDSVCDATMKTFSVTPAPK